MLRVLISLSQFNLSLCRLSWHLSFPTVYSKYCNSIKNPIWKDSMKIIFSVGYYYLVCNSYLCEYIYTYILILLSLQEKVVVRYENWVPSSHAPAEVQVQVILHQPLAVPDPHPAPGLMFSSHTFIHTSTVFRPAPLRDYLLNSQQCVIRSLHFYISEN